jgi:2-aminoadipate transaminase
MLKSGGDPDDERPIRGFLAAVGYSDSNRRREPGMVGQLEGWTDRFAGRTRIDLGGDIASILALANADDVISFGGGFPDPETFPTTELADLLRELLAAGDASTLQYSPVEGLAGTRAYLRERLHTLEGGEPSEPELMVTSGGIDGLQLLGMTFLDSGDAVVVEAPTYLGAVMSFRRLDARVVGVALDDGGLRVDDLEQRLSSGLRPKLLYTIPDHQNPAGVSMAPDRRSALVGLARRYGFLVVEDVAYRELGFADERLPSLWTLGPDVVVQIGTFSKTFFPGVRLGWAAGPADVVRALVAAKQLSDQCSGALGQRLLEEYGRRGLLDEGIRRARTLYRRRSERMQAALAASMPPEVSWTRPSGGFFCWATLPPWMDATELAPEASARGVAYVPGSSFFPDGTGRNTIRLAFSKVRDDLIDEGVERLAELVTARLRTPV